MVQLLFEQSQNLWFLLLLPLLVLAHFYFLRHIQRRALLFANFRALKRITGKRIMTRNYTMLSIRVIIFLFLILGVSGATLWYEGESNTNDFVIAMDTSASMSSQDVLPTRLEAAKVDAKLFVDTLDDDTKIGVVSFAGVAIIQATPTKNKEKVKDVLDDIVLLRAGGTDIPGAIITSTNMLLDNTKGRSIIMITDGSNTIETFTDASTRRALDYAAEHRVSVHAIGVGSETGPIGYLPSYYNVSSTYNEENLLQITNTTSGIYVKAENSQELLEAFEKISESTSTQLLRRDLRPLFLLLGLLLLIFEWTLMSTRFRTLP